MITISVVQLHTKKNAHLVTVVNMTMISLPILLAGNLILAPCVLCGMLTDFVLLV